MSALPAQKPNLFLIEEELNQIALAFDALSESGENPETLQAIENYFANLLDNRDDKLDAYAALYRKYKAWAKIRKEESARLSALAKADENAAERLKDRLEAFFRLHNFQQLETNLNKFRIQGNGGVIPLVVSEDINWDDVPRELLKKELSNEAVRQQLEAGKELPFAKFGERGSGLRIA